jgi:hypothetical protein
MNSAMQSGTSMAHSAIFARTKPTPNHPYKQFYQTKSRTKKADFNGVDLGVAFLRFGGACGEAFFDEGYYGFVVIF